MLSLILKHLKGYVGDAIKTPILMILEVLCELALPLIMAEIVDVAIPTGDTASIFRLGGLMLALSGVAMACGVGGARYSSYASQGFGANLRQHLFDHAQEFSFADIDRFSSASLITRMTNDVNTMIMMLAIGLRMMVRAPVMLFSALGICLYLNPRLAVILLVTIPVMVTAIVILMTVCTKLFDALQQKIDGLNGILQENLIAIRTVKAFVREPHERAKFKQANDALMQAGLDVGMRIIAAMPLMMLCLNGATVAVLYFGGRLVMNTDFALGQLQAFIQYIVQILMSVMMLAMTLLHLSRSQACARRIGEVLDTDPSVKEPAQAPQALPAPRGRLEMRGVSFKYSAEGTGDAVLANINLTVEPGRFVAIVGGTGTGKSTLVNLIPRFYDVTEGSILLDGLDVREYPLEQLRRRIGMVLQNNVLFRGTIRENLLWGKAEATEQELIQATQDAQADEFISAFPDGLDTMLEQGGVNLSGGQRQRLCIARAMLRKPAMLILDDATSAVDSSTEGKIRAVFDKSFKDTTILVIAQRISSIRYADEIFVLDDDHIVGHGTHAQLLAENAIYQEIYSSQQEGVAQE